jgi:hypothetical protein
MVKLSPGGRTLLRNGDIHVSKPAVTRALQSLNLPQDLAEKLNHIGKSRKQTWAIQAGKLLLEQFKQQISDKIKSMSH